MLMYERTSNERKKAPISVRAHDITINSSDSAVMLSTNFDNSNMGIMTVSGFKRSEKLFDVISFRDLFSFLFSL